MRRYTHETITALQPAQLFRAIADIGRWPEWDRELEATTIDGPVRDGARFTLKPNGGPEVAMLVEAADAPGRFADVALLPLARLRTVHEFTACGAGTAVRTTIEVTGPLAFLWDRIVVRKQAASAEAQTKAFLAFAEMTKCSPQRNENSDTTPR